MERFYAIHNTPIFLGRQGESNAREVAFDIAPWEELYGTGTVQLFARRHGESVMYPVPFTRDGSLVVWTVVEGDVGVVGQTGECELSYQPNDDTMVKSETWSTFVLPSMDGEVGEAPDAAKAWIDVLRQETANQQKIAEQAVLSATDAAQSAGVAGGRASAAAKSAEAAEAAKRAITEMEVSATSLSQGESATVSTELVDGVYRMLIGIPGGAKGDTGPQGPKGDKLQVVGYAVEADYTTVYLDSGETFKVPNGKNGAAGAAGVGIDRVWQSEESEEDGGKNKISVQLTNGVQGSFSVRNGKTGSKGEPGKTPVRGTDYWTAEDQQDIVSAVLANFTDVSEVGM